MAQAQNETAEERGCAGTAKTGCGCLGMGVGVLVLYGIGSWIVGNVFFYYPVLAWGVVGSLGCLGAGGVVGLMLRGQVATWWRQMQALQPILFGFGVVCLVTAIGMSLRPSGISIEQEVPAMGGTVGPIEIPRSDMQTAVRVYQSVHEGTGGYYQRWSFITLEVLDEDKTYLTSLGGDVWNYAGYDDGHWEEEDEQYTATLVFPSAGSYYIDLKTEANVGASELSPITFELYERAAWGNPAPFQWAAYLAFLLGAAFVVAPRVWCRKILMGHLRDGSLIRFEGREWRVQAQAHYVYDDWQADEWTLHPTGPGGTPRYLEYEYEEESTWTNWVVSQPLSMDQIQAGGDGEGELAAYIADRGTWPDVIRVDGRRYTLEEAGTGQRNGTTFSYHNYEDANSRFVTVEGASADALSAVEGGPVSPTDITIPDDADWA